MLNWIWTATYSLLTCIHPDWSFSWKGNVLGQWETIDGKVSEGKYLSEKMSWRRKSIARLQKAALSPYRVTRLSCPPKDPKYLIGEKLQSSRVGPPNCYEILELCKFLHVFSRHKLGVFSDSKTLSFAPNSEFLCKTLQIYFKNRST